LLFALAPERNAHHARVVDVGLNSSDAVDPAKWLHACSATAGIVYVRPRIVHDTNVVVAGLRSRLGASYRLLSLVGTGRFVHIISVPLLFEYETAIARPESGIDLRSAIDDVLDYLCAAGERQEIYFLWRPTLPDPSDDLVLEVAAHGRCDRIVTFNKRDFAGSERFGIQPVTPIEFFRSLGIAS
jgi:predicted nucleic acid-binding protein